jgi:hypothetical protein
MRMRERSYSTTILILRTLELSGQLHVLSALSLGPPVRYGVGTLQNRPGGFGYSWIYYVSHVKANSKGTIELGADKLKI